MNLLKEKIINDGQVIDGRILKVDSFLNHQLDIRLFNAIGKEFRKRFADKKVTKILTVESSGIGIACIAAQYFDVPVVFAKKGNANNMEAEVYQSEVYSFTKGQTYIINVAKKFLSSDDKVLIIDDFLANGNAAKGLLNIGSQAGAEIVGIGIVIEKSFQKGRDALIEQGVTVESLAIIEAFQDGKIIFK